MTDHQNSKTEAECPSCGATKFRLEEREDEHLGPGGYDAICVDCGEHVGAMNRGSMPR